MKARHQNFAASARGTAAGGPNEPWALYSRTFMAWAPLLFIGSLCLLLLVDPYDTGRFLRLPGTPGVHHQVPSAANASRGRDESFRAAIFGNSTVQLIEPAALAQAIGAPVTSLVVAGSGPEEQLAIADWVLRHHRDPPIALIFGLDGTWCTAGPDLRGPHPFPFWLYSPSTWQYLMGMVRLSALRQVWPRVRYLIGHRKLPPARPDGFWDYEIDYQRIGYDALSKPTLTTVSATAPINLTGEWPALEALSRLLAKVPAETVVVLLRPPVFITGLPTPGSTYETSERRCAARAQAIADSRPRTAHLNWRSDRPEIRDPDNFHDHFHYGRTLARRLEADIASAVDRLRGETAVGSAGLSARSDARLRVPELP